MAAPTIVFDLDGTLIDTAPDLIAILNRLFARERLELVTYEEGRRLIGGGARSLIERALALHGRTCTPTAIDHLYRDYIADYAAHIADLSRPFPGLEAALDDLAARGWRFAVCTNKLEALSVRLLDALGLSSRFAAICGPDTFGMQKPDPAILLATLAAAGSSADAAVMVGDSENDIATARAAGVPVVAVDFGYTPVPVARFAPDRLISHFAELPAAIYELLGSPRPA